MAEPFKVKFEYNPNNVEAEVPGVQKLRRNSGSDVSNEVMPDTFYEEPVITVTKKEATFTKGDLKLQKVTVTEDISVNFKYLFNQQTLPGKTVARKTGPINSSEVVSGAMDDGRITRRHSENVNSIKDKNDILKTHSKIPRFKQTVEKVQAERRGSRDKESHIPIRRSSIPKLKINKAINTPTKINNNKTIYLKTDVVETTTEDDFDKLYEEVVCSTPTPVNIDLSLLNPKVEDPEKLESKFEEIVHDYDDIITPEPKEIETKKSTTSTKATNSYKLKTVVENVKKSKIPSLKRNQQETVEIRGGKIIAARDRVRLSQGSRLDVLNNVSENVSANTGTQEGYNTKKNQFEVKTTFENDAAGELTKTVTTTVSTLDTNKETSIKVVGSKTVTEIKTSKVIDMAENKTGHIIEENIDCKSSIKIGIPVFDSCVDEYTETNENENKVTVRQEQTTKSMNGDTLEIMEATEIVEIKYDPVITEEMYEPKIVETIDWNENNDCKKHIQLKEDNQKDTKEAKTGSRDKDGSIDDISNLRGKVGRLISKIDTHEPIDVKAPKLDFGNPLAKNKSIMSKIAMFEHHVEPEPKVPKNNGKLPKLIATNTLKIEHIHVHTPLIVEEVLKPFEAIKKENVSATNGEITTRWKENNAQIARAEMIIIETPEIVRYDVGNGIEVDSTLVIEPLKLAEEVLTPLPREFEPNNDHVESVHHKECLIEEKVLRPSPRQLDAKEVTDNNNARYESKYTIKPETQDTSVIAPKYIPVREVLKRYESLNDQEIKKNKIAKDLAKIRSIKSEIIDDLKPEEYRRSLDELFVHQARPASEILNDLKYENHKRDHDDDVFLAEPTKPKDPYDNNKQKTPDPVIETYKSKDYTLAVGPKTTKLEDSNDKDTRPTYKSYHEPRKEPTFKSLDYIQDYHEVKLRDSKRAKSLAELDLGDAIKGNVNRMIVRINSMDKLDDEVKETANPISIKEMPRKKSVLEKIALFENKMTTAKEVCPQRSLKPTLTEIVKRETATNTQAKVIELSNAKIKYGKMELMPYMELANGVMMPVLAVGTALMDPQLTFHVVSAAIDIGYRAIDTAFIYGNEKAVGEAIKAKIDDGTVTREELFIISKLWSTFHRSDLVERACAASLEAMGLEYFDLFLIHNPMSFKEGKSPMPRIATVLQYSEHDYLDAWFGMEALGTRARALGVSNFNSVQIRRVLDRARVKPVVNQVECHPYLSQQKLDNFCSERNITLSCFGVLGSKGTPLELTSGQPAAIDDPLVQVMASGLGVSPAQLLIRYQLQCGHNVVVKSTSAAHLWDNLQALTFNLTSVQVDALHALNRNKRIFVFRGMGDTHKNYPFNVAF